MGCQSITIYKGEDSAAFGVRRIRIIFNSSIPLDAATAEFRLLSYSKIFSTEAVETNNMELRFAKADTKEFPLGLNYASFRLYDKRGLLVTATTRIPILVKTPDKTMYPVTESVTVEAECVSITIQAEIDYTCVYNRPKINHVELVGDLSWEDLGLPELASGVIVGYYHDSKFYKKRSGTGTVEDPYIYSEEVVPNTSIIYVDKESNSTFRWDDTKYVKIGGGGSGMNIHLDPEDNECVIFEEK